MGSCITQGLKVRAATALMLCAASFNAHVGLEVIGQMKFNVGDTAFAGTRTLVFDDELSPLVFEVYNSGNRLFRVATNSGQLTLVIDYDGLVEGQLSML